MRCKDCPDYQNCVRQHDLRTYRRRCIKAKKGAKLAGTASGDLSLPELLQAIRRLKVETGIAVVYGRWDQVQELRKMPTNRMN